MDPQATLERILDALANEDGTELVEACQDLANWLRKGGFAPKMPPEGLGETRQAIHSDYGMKYRTVPRKGFWWEGYAIQCVDPVKIDGRWEFVSYSPKGSRVETWALN